MNLLMKKIVLILALVGTLLSLGHAGSISISFGSGWNHCARPAYRPIYYRPVYYYDNCAPTMIYRPYPIYYSRPYYQRPSYGYSYFGSSYRQGFQDGYSTAVRRALPVYRAERVVRR